MHGILLLKEFTVVRKQVVQFFINLDSDFVLYLNVEIDGDGLGWGIHLHGWGAGRCK
jgi:hypothetical protein